MEKYILFLVHKDGDVAPKFAFGVNSQVTLPQLVQGTHREGESIHQGQTATEGPQPAGTRRRKAARAWKEGVL